MDATSDDCDYYWEEAEAAMTIEHDKVPSDLPPFGNANKLKMIIEMPTSKKQVLCFKNDLFLDKGWCPVRKTGDPEYSWGICSTSCSLENRKKPVNVT